MQHGVDHGDAAGVPTTVTVALPAAQPEPALAMLQVQDLPVASTVTIRKGAIGLGHGGAVARAVGAELGPASVALWRSDLVVGDVVGGSVGVRVACASVAGCSNLLAVVRTRGANVARKRFRNASGRNACGGCFGHACVRYCRTDCGGIDGWGWGVKKASPGPGHPAARVSAFFGLALAGYRGGGGAI